MNQRLRPLLIYLICFSILLNLANAQQTCYSDGREFPVSCSSGTITSDTWDGCRHVTCSDSQGSFTIRACPKGFIELYNETWIGPSKTVSLADACMRAGVDNYVKSSNPPVCDNVQTSFISVHRDSNYPIEHNMILQCDVSGFTPNSYSWNLGDGIALTTSTNRLFHTYSTNGEYLLSCIAVDGTNTRQATNLITIDSPIKNPNPSFPYYVSVSTGEISSNTYEFRCNDFGFRPQQHE